MPRCRTGPAHCSMHSAVRAVEERAVPGVDVAAGELVQQVHINPAGHPPRRSLHKVNPLQ